ncbi:MAG: glycosyltransferase family 2 protein [Candidatus Nezhaarchaeota archaeon]|nr:glycosyltransferase family 2 protein [Candidatus Nezhaarchaeota archaeon]
MPEPALHFSIIFALSAPRLGVKRALALSAIALLPDLDVLLHVHRSMSHSAIIIGLAWLLVLLPLYFFKRKYLALGALGLLATLSHSLMDCFQTYTPILYPFLDRSLWIKVDGRVSISPEGITPQASIGIADSPTVFSSFQLLDAPLFTSEGFLVSLLLMAIPLLLEVKGAGRSVGGADRALGARVLTKSPLDDPAVDTGALEAPVPKDMVTVVLPTLNEEKSIGLVIDELVAEGYKNLLVVDGYSSDRTVEVARSKGVEVVYQKGVGKAGAIATAIERVSTPYMLVMDGDHTYDPRDIERLLRYARGYDEVIGYRSNRGNIPLLHRVGNRVISLALSLMFGRQIRDPCSGMYLLRTDMAKRLELSSSGFDVEVEVAGQVASLGRIAEVPVSYRRRVGEAKLKAWRDGLKILMASVRVMWLYNPVFMLSALAALLTVPGAAILLWQFTLRHFYGAGAWSLGWSWLGLVLFVAGLQGIAVAATSLMLKRVERRIVQALRPGAAA